MHISHTHAHTHSHTRTHTQTHIQGGTLTHGEFEKIAVFGTVSKKGVVPRNIEFPGSGGRIRHWRASGAAPRGREGCGT